jgi:Sulfotransferase domain
VSAPPRIVSMWCGPRNVSTALMYSWRERSDTYVVDEPFYGPYLARSGVDHPGRDDLLAHLPLDVETMVEELRRPRDRPLLFLKNMAHHLPAAGSAVLDGMENALLIRDPADVIRSLAATLGERIELAQTGLPQQLEIVEHERAKGLVPIVVDTHDLLDDPAGLLGRLCERLGIEFEVSMLGWGVGPKPEDGRWATYWYANAHRSTGFGPYPVRPGPFPEGLRPLLDEAAPLYERLRRERLTAT